MYVEAFHRVLKYIYLKGKVNKRLDKCVGVLLKLARDKGYERLVKLEKGKNTERITQIRKRHQASLKMPTNLVHATEEYLTWEVCSQDKTNTYYVSQLNKECPYSCSINCTDCNICIHSYTCNCPDALIRATICKHIHLFVRATSSTKSSDDVQKEEKCGVLDNLDEITVLENQWNPTSYLHTGMAFIHNFQL